MKLLRAQASRSAFSKVLEARKIELADLIPGTGFALVCAFYATRRVEGVNDDEDGDQLLFQWGIHDSGSGERFKLDMVRQFLWRKGEDDTIKQLSLGFEYRPTRELRALGDGSGWCHAPLHLEDFVSFVTTTRAYQTLEQVEALEVTLTYAAA